MSAQDTARKVVDAVTRLAKNAEAIAHVREGASAYVRFAAGELTTSGASDVNAVSLTVALGRRHATVTTNQQDDASLTALAARAVEVARLAPEDPEWVPVARAQAFPSSPQAHDPQTRAQPPQARAAVARTAIALSKANDVIVAGFYEAGGHDTHLATSAGLAASHSQSVARLTVTARSGDATGSGWAGAEETKSSVVDARATSEQAIAKCLRSRRPTTLAPGRYDVVLEPAAVGELVSFLTDALDARAADEGRSFLSRKTGSAVGERLFSPCVTLRSDPTDAATASATFDRHGSPLRPTTWIEDGTLKTLRTSRFWGKKNGADPTGEPNTWCLSGGTSASVDALVKQVERGLLVTRFWYCRWLDEKSLMVTGLTRDGVFLIERGEVTSPVNNFRFNDSPARVLANIAGMTARGARVPSRDGIVRMPAVAAAGFNMASASAAV